MNYNIERFYTKWLNDLKADQNEDGSLGSVISNIVPQDKPSAGRGDAAVICPRQIYMTYGHKEILENQFSNMKKWVDYITSSTKDPFLWTGGSHFGDWLGLDVPEGTYKGSSRDDFIATAYYANAASLVAKAGYILGYDVSCYEKLDKNIVAEFRKTFPVYKT